MSRYLVATTGHSVPLLGGETYVGTDPGVQIPVRGEMGLLPRHFVIAPRERGWKLEAFEGATVLVNGREVRQMEIHDGDQIVAGQLTLTYRDEQEAALAQAMAQAKASMSKNSFPSLHLGLPTAGPSTPPPLPPSAKAAEVRGWSLPSGPLPPPPPPPPLPLPETGHEQAGYEDSPANEDLARRPKEGRWDHFLLIGLGMLLLGCGVVQVTKMLLTPEIKPVKATDLVFIKAEIFGGVQVPREVNHVSYLDGVQGIEIVVAGQVEDPKYSWSGTRSAWSRAVSLGHREDARHVRHSILDLPKDLTFDPAWQEPGNVAKIGILKKDYNYEALMMRNWDFSMRVATLEVNGKSYRSLAQLNASRAASQAQFLPFAGPGMLLLGLFFLVLGVEKWKTRTAQRR
ncbi:hypothetical protein [Prosthecobacter sp.]|uniref:hypothetical protein n=1 Tax=Prosthecobacter sp. TaxID=1965333 RepID=UPI003784A3A5